MRLSDLVVTQNAVRNPAQIETMVKFVRAGGFFSDDALLAFSVAFGGAGRPPVMRIVRTEDGLHYLCDGLHRAVAKLKAGKSRIDPSEYTLERRPYSAFTELDLDAGWYTPYDPRFEVRKADFFRYKNDVRLIRDTKLDVARHKFEYAETRICTTIEDVLNRLELN